MSDNEYVMTNSPPKIPERETLQAHGTIQDLSSDEKPPSTAKKDVVDAITEIEDKGQGSKFLMGHISTEKLKDTFLIDEEQKYPDCDLNLNCKMHGRPAVFYSKQDSDWKCYLCVLDDKGLIYLDKQYKLH